MYFLLQWEQFYLGDIGHGAGSSPEVCVGLPERPVMKTFTTLSSLTSVDYTMDLDFRPRAPSDLPSLRIRNINDRAQT